MMAGGISVLLLSCNFSSSGSSLSGLNSKLLMWLMASSIAECSLPSAGRGACGELVSSVAVRLRSVSSVAASGVTANTVSSLLVVLGVGLSPVVIRWLVSSSASYL